VGLVFAVQRPFRLLRDVLVDRDRPDLAGLAAIRDPHRFVWAILPHAARTFSAAIALLPRALGEASAVAYLYCRILDTYEDLVACPRERDRALLRFAERLETGAPAPTIATARARDGRDEAHLLLVRRCALVDEAYRALPADDRVLVRSLVHGMAEGMRWSSAAFESQGGALEDEAQLLRYCRHVLGGPVLFAGRLVRRYHVGDAALSPAGEADAQAVGEMIQLANVTRDIEKDLARGIAYHPSLRADLAGTSPDGAVGRARRVRMVRAALLRTALARVLAYRRLLDHVQPPRWSMARTSAVLMLLFTDRYYRGCARRGGLRPWGARPSGLRLLLLALPAVFSRRWTQRVMRRVERDFLAAAARARPSGAA
jgi:phytoene/squalene synthetase